MAFGQQSGSPATGKQVQELLSLLQAAGHSDFRDARGPMGFSQRQAGGKFTREEATAFIDQLQEPDHGPPSGDTPASVPARVAPKRLSSAEQALARVPSSLLAAELQSRGWIVVEP
jgi:hypothetical protein